MLVAEWLAVPRELDCATADWQPLGLLDLYRWPSDFPIERVPPFPLIGFGSAASALAISLDAVEEVPVFIKSMMRQIMLNPNAAAVTMQLLRSINGLPLGTGLVLESLCFGLLQGSTGHLTWLTT
jgi:hypothetical protein